ncbi:MAG: hypothetical protein GY724_03620 [Actinomycetia bacterium]|nr:hypothetical protein [Actinomycetes bacterium]MCP5031578.1 hypothetical protein [Actinomycetes bacterium]
MPSLSIDLGEESSGDTIALVRSSLIEAMVTAGMLVVATGCTGSADESAVTATDPASSYPFATECSSPPPIEQQRLSSLLLTVEPNPVKAGSGATLALASDGLGSNAMSGAGVTWQCWDGSGWVSTGLPVPNSYPILIPNEPPGIYRIQDIVIDNGSERTGFVLLEVE